MKITLPIKDMSGKLIEKKTIEYRSIRVGMVKRLFKIIDVDTLMKECKTVQDVANYLMSRSMIMSSFMEELIESMFGITDEEFDNLEVEDVVGVTHILIAESLRKLETTEEGLKNLLRAEQ